jgi:hypothetical protein
MTDRSAESAPTKARKSDWAGRFLEVFRSTCNVRLSADAAGIDRDTAYRRRQRDPAFARLWVQAEQDGLDVLEAECRRRSLSSSDTLLMFLLRAHRPDRYRERVDIRIDMKFEAQTIARELGVSVEGLFAEAERLLEISGL